MSNQKEREAIRAVYKNSPSWQEKVTKMSDRQVTAIYLKFKAQGKLVT